MNNCTNPQCNRQIPPGAYQLSYCCLVCCDDDQIPDKSGKLHGGRKHSNECEENHEWWKRYEEVENKNQQTKGEGKWETK